MNKETTSFLSPSGCWTDEKHSDFLNSMEASFVRTMFESKSGRRHTHLRLDRQIPDTSESTLDLKTQSNSRNKVLKLDSDSSSGRRGRNMNGGCDKRSGRTKSQPLNSSDDDQVVPQLQNRNVGDKDEKVQ